MLKSGGRTESLHLSLFNGLKLQVVYHLTSNEKCLFTFCMLAQRVLFIDLMSCPTSIYNLPKLNSSETENCKRCEDDSKVFPDAKNLSSYFCALTMRRGKGKQSRWNEGRGRGS